MADSWLLNAPLCALPGTSEALPVRGGASTPGYIEHAAAVALFNGWGSGSLLRVKDVQVNEYSSRTATIAQAIALQRITALTGGEAVVPAKLDTASANLPAQVSIVRYPATITAVDATLRRKMLGPSITTGTNLGTFWAGRAASQVAALHNTGIQPQTLREGEGIALLTGSAASANYALQWRIWLGVGAASYLVETATPSRAASPAVLAVLNGAGSGVVLTVDRVEIQEFRSVDSLSLVNVETISGLYGGVALSPVALDSTAAALPAEVLIRSSGAALQAGADAHQSGRGRGGGDSVPLRRVFARVHGAGVGLAGWVPTTTPQQRRAFHAHGHDPASSCIVLREGEGLGIFRRPYVSAYADALDVAILFTADTTPGGAGETFTGTLLNRGLN